MQISRFTHCIAGITMALSNTNPLEFNLDRFENPFGNTPFLSDNEDENLDLWTWKKHIVAWTLKLVKSSAMLMMKIVWTDPYIPLHVNARATAFEPHHAKYMVVKCILNQSDEGRDAYHFAIVVEVGQNCGAQFDPHGFLEHLKLSRHGMFNSWKENLHKWEDIDQEKTCRKLGRILTDLAQGDEGPSMTSVPKKKSVSTPNLPPMSGASTPGSDAANRAEAAGPKRKFMETQSQLVRPNQKLRSSARLHSPTQVTDPR